MKILVTGGAGFIGSHLVEALQNDHQVVVTDDFNDFYPPVLKEQNTIGFSTKVRKVAIDIADADAVDRIFDSHGPFDLIIHLAARAGVRPSIQHPALYVRTNVEGTLNLLEAARKSGTRRFIFASSSSVYGLAPLPFTEDMPLLQTISPYAATKLAGEQLCANYAHLYGIRTVALRFFTVYGPRQRPDLAIYKFADLMLRGKPIPVFGDGTTRRDYTYVRDIVQGITAAISYEGPVFDIFNLGENRTVTLSELISRMESALGVSAIIDRQPAQPGDLPATWADITKARSVLGYAPTTALEDGLAEFATWFRAHRAVPLPPLPPLRLQTVQSVA